MSHRVNNLVSNTDNVTIPSPEQNKSETKQYSSNITGTLTMSNTGLLGQKVIVRIVGNLVLNQIIFTDYNVVI